MLSVEVAYQMTPTLQGIFPGGHVCNALSTTMNRTRVVLLANMSGWAMIGGANLASDAGGIWHGLAWSTEIRLLQINCVSHYMLEAWTDIRGAVIISSRKARLLTRI